MPESLLQQPWRRGDDRIVTELNHVRIFNLLSRATTRGAGHNAIVDLIDHAQLVSPQDVPADVVTMGSLLLVAAGSPGSSDPRDCREVRLCYPEEANAATGCLSVLTPEGACLLGLRVGDVARWTTPNGSQDAAEIVQILFQPEAHGEFVA